jgi:hypothetical protein
MPKSVKEKPARKVEGRKNTEPSCRTPIDVMQQLHPALSAQMAAFREWVSGERFAHLKSIHPRGEWHL